MHRLFFIFKKLGWVYFATPHINKKTYICFPHTSGDVCIAPNILASVFCNENFNFKPIPLHRNLALPLLLPSLDVLATCVAPHMPRQRRIPTESLLAHPANVRLHPQVQFQVRLQRT